MLALTTMLTVPTFARMTSTALITGASSGLGEEFAHRFAARGENVVLVARRADRLETLARRIEADHGVTATAVAMDLGVPGIGESLRKALADKGVTPTTLVNNAGFGTHGRFRDEDPARVASEIALNVSALVDLTHAFLPNLTGALINIASTAAYQPTPNMAVYGATKAFVLNFTEALAYEYRTSPLKILALSPPARRAPSSSTSSDPRMPQWATSRPPSRWSRRPCAPWTLAVPLPASCPVCPTRSAPAVCVSRHDRWPR